MLVRTRRFHSRLTEQEHEQLRELARLLDVDLTRAALIAVAEKLKRVKSKQKAPANTEAA